MRNFTATYIAVFVFFALCAYLLYFRVAPVPVLEDPMADAIWVYQLEADDVAGFRVEPDGLSLYRDEDGNWQVRTDTSYRLDDSRIRMLVTLVTSLRSERLVVEDATDMSLYGLDEPWRRLIVELTDGQQVIVEFGDEVPLGGTFYARQVESSDVHRVPHHIVEGIGWQIENLRSIWVNEFEPGEVESFAVYEDGIKKRAFTRVDLGKWVMTAPWNMPADWSEVEDYIRRFRFLRAEEFTDDAPTVVDLEAYGLSSPHVRFEAKMKDGRVVEIAVGKVSDGEHEVMYAQSDDEPYVYLVMPMRQLVASPDEFLVRRIVPHDMHHFEYVRVRTGEAMWEAAGPVWHETTDEREFTIGGRLEEPVRSIVSRLTRVNAQGIAGVRDVMPLPANSGPHPAVHVTYRVAGDDEVTFILVRDDVGLYHARLPDHGASIWLDAEVIDSFLELTFDQ